MVREGPANQAIDSLRRSRTSAARQQGWKSLAADPVFEPLGAQPAFRDLLTAIDADIQQDWAQVTATPACDQPPGQDCPPVTDSPSEVRAVSGPGGGSQRLSTEASSAKE